ncbi:dual specificity protein phosphatase 22 isoform X3 [Manis pentadactyla]|uniref:dual specificity protein phosphatase 22 isoform X3 n=1 Tax=Manis pentadactyla TaxID=143292 RepID=UPI00187405B3|nr:dual specificity protein phosphatase 22 isoform X3 [Manis pentadactyla]
MGNGMNKILPGLYIGNFKDARDAEQLSKNKVTHILSVHDSARPMLEGVKYLCIPAADSPSQNLTRHFKESIKFIHECRLRGEGCLVHCLAGVSRSVTLVIAYIMTVTDFGWEDALHTVRAGRSCANPNLGFQRQLQEFEKHEVHQYRQWLKEEYGESPLRDAEEAKNILVMFFFHSYSRNSEVLGLSKKTVMYLKFLKYYKATEFRLVLPKRKAVQSLLLVSRSDL